MYQFLLTKYSNMSANKCLVSLSDIHPHLTNVDSLNEFYFKSKLFVIESLITMKFFSTH